jgi:hypothetical protein
MSSLKSLEDGPVDSTHSVRPSSRRRWLVLGAVLALGLMVGLVLWLAVFKNNESPRKEVQVCPAGVEYLTERTCDQVCAKPFQFMLCTGEVKGPGCGCPRDRPWYYGNASVGECYTRAEDCPNF